MVEPVILLVTTNDIIPNEDLNNIVENLGIALFSSGAFAAVLKSFQFAGIFKKEIEKVMLDTSFVEKRSDLPELWSTISQVIYKNKFPLISSNLEKRILETYFPTNSEYYYEDMVVTICIDKISDDFEIEYTQTVKFKVILDENIDGTELVSKSSIDNGSEGQETINERIYSTVDGKEFEPIESAEKTESGITYISKTPLIGKGPFIIEKQYNRKYSLKDENYKLYRVETFVQGMSVSISFPENVSVSFFNIGNVTLFEKEHKGIKNVIFRSHKNDILLPKQGFGLSFERN